MKKEKDEESENEKKWKTGIENNRVPGGSNGKTVVEEHENEEIWEPWTDDDPVSKEDERRITSSTGPKGQSRTGPEA